jgi:hypothetical protein
MCSNLPVTKVDPSANSRPTSSSHLITFVFSIVGPHEDGQRCNFTQKGRRKTIKGHVFPRLHMIDKVVNGTLQQSSN